MRNEAYYMKIKIPTYYSIQPPSASTFAAIAWRILYTGVTNDWLIHIFSK